MILKYFSQYLKDTNEVPTLEILFKWIKLKLETPAVCHEDKIIQSEIYLATKFEELLTAFPNNIISVEIKQKGEETTVSRRPATVG